MLATPAATISSESVSPRFNAARRWSLRRFGPIAELELIAYWQLKSGLLGDLVIGPIVYFALFAAGIGGVITSGAGGDGVGNYLAFVLPGFLVLQGFNTFPRSIYRSTIDRRWGLLALKRLLGAGGLGYVLALMVVPIINFLAKSVAITTIALILGVRMQPLSYLAAILLTCVLLTFWATLAILITGWITNYEQRDIMMGLLILPMTFGAPIFYSLDTAPRYLRIIALCNPLSYQVMAVRDVFNGENPGWWLVAALGATAAVVIAAVHSVTKGELLGKEG
ncbi:MAG: ABC transporter permease [Thermomicrobiales bacterium]